MRQRPSELDFDLLLSDPDEFILRCQNIILIFVKRYIGSGMFQLEDMEDIIQSVNETLIKKLPYVKSHFNGTVLMQTYIGAIIQNICIDLHRQYQRRYETAPMPETPQLLVNIPEKNILIEEELRRLRRILTQFGKDQYKLMVCLKLHFRIPMHSDEVRSGFPGLKKKDADFLLSVFGTNYDGMKVEDMFEIVTQMFITSGGRNLQWESLRRWTQIKVEEVIRLMDGTPRRRAHNEETLKFLLEQHTMSYSDSK